MATKQSSPEMSSLAARYLSKGRHGVIEMIHENRQQLIDDVLALAGSVVSQDEVKGQARRIRKADAKD